MPSKIKRVQTVLSFLFFLSPVFFGASCAISDEGEHVRTAAWRFASDVDASTTPGNDFYQYAVGGWLAANPLDASSEVNGTIVSSEIKSEKFFSDIMANGSGDVVLNKIASEIKSVERDWENQVLVPAQRMVSQIRTASSKEELIPVFARMVCEGYNPVLSVTFTPVAREVEILLQLGRVECSYKDGLPEDYYICSAVDGNFSVSPEISALVNASDVLLPAKNFIMRLETGVNMGASTANTKIRSQLSSTNYIYKVLVEAGFSASQLANAKYVGVLDSYFKNLDDCDLDELKAYLTLIVYDEMYRFSREVSVDGTSVSYTNFEYAFRKRNFAKYNLLKVAAETNVSSENKVAIKKMLEEIRSSFIERVDSLDWMSSATKSKAKEKARNTEFFVGYPERYNRDFVLDNFSETNCFDDVHQLEKKTFSAFLKNTGNVNEGILWALLPTVADPLSFNAYHHHVNNYVIINPFACCKPFCDLSQGDAYTYGVLGFVLGHEFTHGFDAVGAGYDKNGVAKDWWSNDDKANFLKKQKQFAELFSKFDIYSGVMDTYGEHNDGYATLVENMADFGGMTLSHHAYMEKKKKETSDSIQLAEFEKNYYLSAAQCYKGNQSNLYKLRSRESDRHSNFKIRVNGNVVNMPSWYNVFDVHSDDALYLPPEERIVLW